MVNKLKRAYRMWRCDHFDHPYRQVINDDSNRLILDDCQWCGYCQRMFDTPLYYPDSKGCLVDWMSK